MAYSSDHYLNRIQSLAPLESRDKSMLPSINSLKYPSGKPELSIVKNSLYDITSFLEVMKGHSNSTDQKYFYGFDSFRPKKELEFDENAENVNTTINNNPLLDTMIDTVFLSLYPKDIWASGKMTARQIIDQFFKRRSSKKMPFHYKLYNALQITNHNSQLVPLFGAQWVSQNVFKIYRMPFARILGVASINGALFNKQGSLPTHGFVPVNPQTVFNCDSPLIRDVDNDSVRLFRHHSAFFHMGATEQDLAKCRWKNPRSD